MPASAGWHREGLWSRSQQNLAAYGEVEYLKYRRCIVVAHIFLTVGNDDSNSERLEDDFKTQFDTTYAERI